MKTISITSSSVRWLLLLSVLSVLALVPLFVFAQEPDLEYLTSATREAGSVVALLLPVVTALALLLFIWGLATFIYSAGDEDGRAKGRQRMIWGVIALFVIVSVWGIVSIVRVLTGTSGTTSVQGGIPTVDNLPQ